MPVLARSPQDRPSAWIGELGVVITLSSTHTGGVFSLVECSLAPGRLVPPHVHTREDEYTYVLEGEIGLRVGDQIIQALPGWTVAQPRGIPHTFWNAGPQPVRILSVITPGGFETYFLELAEIFHMGASDQIAALGARYGLTRSMDWVPELTTHYQVKVLGQ